MQRRINQETTSSRIGTKNPQKEKQSATVTSCVSFKRKENKAIPFSEIRKVLRKKKEQQAAANSENTELPEAKREESEAVENTSVDPVGNGMSSSSSGASPQNCSTETNKKRRTFIVLQKNTRSLCSSERLDEMFKELQDTNWDAVLISETWRQNKEMWETHQGHIMVESGKFSNKHGVAVLLNKRWRKGINWIQCACERVVAMSITVNKNPIVLMSVYLPHSGYADYHVEKTYKAIIDITKGDQCAKIIGGDFNAELGPGEGVELSAVGHYTLNKVNARGEWMTQWLLENNLIAVNTMYEKISEKRVTYCSPKKETKQLDYILVDKKHVAWSRDAEATDILHMGSDHRCVMAKFEITAKVKRGKTRHQMAPVDKNRNEIKEDGKQREYLEIEQEVRDSEIKKKNTESETGEATNAKAEAKKERRATEAEGKKAGEASAAGTRSGKKRAEATDGGAAIERMYEAADASAAHAAAALGDCIETWHAEAANRSEAHEAEDANDEDKKIRALVQKRKNVAKTEKEKIREISREIKKRIRENKRKKRQEKIMKILEQVKGTRNIHSIKSVKKRILIPKIKNKVGEDVKTRQGIADAFAKFYEELYKGEEEQEENEHECIEHEEVESSQKGKIAEFAKEEIEAAIHRLKKGKARDSSGVRAEQLKICSDETKEKIRHIFNDIAQQEDFIPKSWRKIRIQVIHKKGSRDDPGNYRPICGLPILYKLFATVLYARLAPGLHRVQPPDQAGFRPNHRCEDHLTVYRVLEQRCREWGVPLYLSTIDFTKAFDSIKHLSIWKSLRHYGVKPAYVRLLQRLYSQQEGSVLTDKESVGFPIKKGTKQGDPLSSLLFNTVLQYSLEENLKSWQENKKGIRLSDATEDCLTNLRFADDVLLFSTSLRKLRDMLCDFKASTEKVGLGIHPDKTKILSNQDKLKEKELTVDNIQIEILKKSESARYLGQKITFQDQETEEIKNRLKAAWAAFHKYRQELTSRDYRLCHRLRLFNMVITPTLTYASGTWTLTKKHEQMIRKAQRKMLRLIIQTKRRYKKKVKTSNNKKEEVPEEKKNENSEDISDKDTEDDMQEDSIKDQDSDVSFQEEADEEIDETENEEDWVSFIKRSTEEAEQHMEKHKLPCWIEVHWRTKWRMARRIVTLNKRRWNKRVFDWQPGLDPTLHPKRSVGRPKRRWEDDLNEFTGTEEGKDKAQYELKNNNSWMNEIEDYKEWKKDEENFSKCSRMTSGAEE